jgi:uncharacterized membrane protein YgcG
LIKITLYNSFAKNNPTRRNDLMIQYPLSRRSFLKIVLAGTATVSVAAIQRIFAYGKAPAQRLKTAPTPAPKPTIDPALANLPSFTLGEPKPGSSFKALGRVTFSWSTFPGAASYLLVFISPTGKMITFATTKTSIDRYVESLPWGGTFTWYVVALDGKGKPIGFSGTSTFDKPELPSFKVSTGGGSDSRSSRLGSGSGGSGGGPGSGGNSGSNGGG